jgi:hypothetical protein
MKGRLSKSNVVSNASGKIREIEAQVLKQRFSGIAKRWQHVAVAVAVSPRSKGKDGFAPRSGGGEFR